MAKDGYYIISERIMARKDLSAGCVKVWAVLNRLQGQKATCWPSYEAIARMTGMSRRQAIRCAQELAAAGEITILRTDRKPNLFSVTERTLRNKRRAWAERKAGIVPIASDKMSLP